MDNQRGVHAHGGLAHAHEIKRGRRVKLGCAQPGETVATFGDALRRLTDSATYLYVDVASSAQSVIDEATARRVREALLAKFRERQYDEGLLTAH